MTAFSAPRSLHTYGLILLQEEGSSVPPSPEIGMARECEVEASDVDMREDEDSGAIADGYAESVGHTLTLACEQR